MESKDKITAIDLIFPILVLTFTGYYIYTIRELSWEAAINGYLTGGTLTVLIILLFFKTAVKIIKNQAEWSFNIRLSMSILAKKRIGLLLMAIVYIVCMWWAGFILPTFFFLILGMFLLGVRSRVQLVAISTVFTVAGYVFFILLLDTRFPKGPIEKLISGIF